MSRHHFATGAVLCALVLTGCGGTVQSHGGAVANVGGHVVTQAELADAISQLRGSYAAQGRPFPKLGTPERARLQGQALASVVERNELSQAAASRGIRVTAGDVAHSLALMKDEYFGGDEKAFRTALTAWRLTLDGVRKNIAEQLLTRRLFDRLTRGVRVSDSQVRTYFAAHRAAYERPASRDVRYLLVRTKRLADALYVRLRANHGASFAADAARYWPRVDSGPAATARGTRFALTRSELKATFLDEAAFTLPTGEIAAPIKTRFGYEIIQPLSKLRPAVTGLTPSTRAAIRRALLDRRKNDFMTRWVDRLTAHNCASGRVHFTPGYVPTPNPCAQQAEAGH